MKTDLSRFNINYFNSFGECDLSIELIELKHQGFLELCEDIITMVKNHFVYIDKQVLNYSVLPTNNITSLKHFLDITGYDVNKINKLKNDLKKLGLESFLENYLYISDYYNLLKNKFINKHKKEDKEIHISYDYNTDPSGILDKSMNYNHKDIVDLNSKISKVLYNDSAYIININILKDDIYKSLSRQDRSLDIHYSKGIACFNAFIKSNKTEYDNVLKLKECKQHKNLFNIIRFIDRDNQNKIYNTKVDIKSKYNGLVIPLKLSKSADIMIETVGNIVHGIITDKFYINGKDGSYHYHDEINTTHDNLWEELINK